ncbi:MAG: hypothetical protein O3A55_02300 [Bacteroidetes bacterium]|nr:hypothetical protein [Bacteroidota bacterium]
MKTLDLHGVKHEDVEKLVENFIFLNENPLKIITGSSNKMKKLVYQILNKHKFNYNYFDDYNLGEVIITK